MPLEERLEKVRKRSSESMPAEAHETFARATRELVESGAAERALGESDPAPDFDLESVDGRRLASADVRRRGPLVLTFFRGKW